MKIFHPLFPFLLFAFLAVPLFADSSASGWNPSLPRNTKLKAIEPPLLLETDKFENFTREMIRVQWRDDDPIYLFVVKPTGITKPPVILYLYGYPSDTDRYLDNDFCNLIVKNGFAAAGFVSALTGHRYHDRPMKEWFVSELREALTSTVEDVEMTLDYLDKRPDLDAKRLGMFGEGSGGTIAILAAANDPRIQAVDLLDPWGDWPDWMAHSAIIPANERSNFLKPEFLKSLESLDPLRWLPKLTNTPVRYQYLTKPAATPQVARDQIENAAPPQTLKVDFDKGLKAYLASNGDDFFDWIKSQKVFAANVK